MVLWGHLSQPLNSSAQEGLCLPLAVEETEAQTMLRSPRQGQAPGWSEVKAHACSPVSPAS